MLYPPDVSENLPLALVVLGSVYFVIGTIGSLLVIKP